MAQQPHQAPASEAYSAGGGDARNRAAQAGNVAAHAAGHDQKKEARSKKIDQEDISRIVAEENASKGKMPRYPGLERWQLLEKMGDGAFSNVYKAQDLEGKAGQVAIKVVRKFEMNSSQVSTGSKPSNLILPEGAPCQRVRGGCRAMHIFIRILRSSLE
jgi:serine/threonine-protein kinase RCK2